MDPQNGGNQHAEGLSDSEQRSFSKGGWNHQMDGVGHWPDMHQPGFRGPGVPPFRDLVAYMENKSPIINSRPPHPQEVKHGSNESLPSIRAMFHDQGFNYDHKRLSESDVVPSGPSQLQQSSHGQTTRPHVPNPRITTPQASSGSSAETGTAATVSMGAWESHAHPTPESAWTCGDPTCILKNKVFTSDQGLFRHYSCSPEPHYPYAIFLSHPSSIKNKDYTCPICKVHVGRSLRETINHVEMIHTDKPWPLWPTAAQLAAIRQNPSTAVNVLNLDHPQHFLRYKMAQARAKQTALSLLRGHF
ncbi:hypothetical protein T439DRAFT_243236 [Meredithblackwellia eburnea MCA 4105]